MISIIVPVLNEEKNIENLLSIIKDLNGDKEIIIVDGGSNDNTIAISKKYGIVLNSKKGRANQMNLGAKYANGNILWFVHSDSLLDNNSIIYIEESINEGFDGGGFSLYFHDYNTWFMKLIAKLSNIRGKVFKIFFGDQGIFVKKDIFNELNGFPNIEIMEDLQFSKNIRAYYKLKLLKAKIGTSGRRFKEGGQFKTIILMHKLKILYFLKVSPQKLVKMYREAR